KLYTFAAAQNLLAPGETKVLMAYHDNPETTEETRLRTSLCLTIPAGAPIKENGEIGAMGLSGKYAVGHFELAQAEYAAAWQYMYGEWLPESGCQPRDAFPFEVYVSGPTQNPGEKQRVAIYLPVEPLGRL
ncbi:MAG: GyrI-like domain-containing protein, partial [Oscillospiraceae bacterium]